MIRGIGVDLVQISRIRRWMERPALLRRWYHPQELEYSLQQGVQAAASLAARFAAKEAFGKSLGIGLAGLTLRHIQVHNARSGKPALILHEEAHTIFERIGGGSILLSLTHDADSAVAVVIIEEKP